MHLCAHINLSGHVVCVWELYYRLVTQCPAAGTTVVPGSGVFECQGYSGGHSMCQQLRVDHLLWSGQAQSQAW